MLILVFLLQYSFAGLWLSNNFLCWTTFSSIKILTPRNISEQHKPNLSTENHAENPQH